MTYHHTTLHTSHYIIYITLPYPTSPYITHTVGVGHMGYYKIACFEGLVLAPHFDQILRPLPATLFLETRLQGCAWLAEFAASTFFQKMQHVKWPLCLTPADCTWSEARMKNRQAVFFFRSPYSGGVHSSPKILRISDAKKEPKTSPL